MKHANKPIRPRLMLWPLLLSLASCAHDSPLLRPVQGPSIPPLPAEARAPETPPECLPTCLQGLTTERESWLDTLTKLGPQP